jgi:hypothetical protein
MFGEAMTPHRQQTRAAISSSFNSRMYSAILLPGMSGRRRNAGRRLWLRLLLSIDLIGYRFAPSVVATKMALGNQSKGFFAQ